MRRMAMGVGAFESPDLGAPSRYLKHTPKNFSQASEVEESIQKIRRILKNSSRNFEI